MKMGNASIEEHVAKFKMLVTKLKLEKNEAVAEYFRETLPIPLQKNIMTLEKPPTTLNEWYKWAIKLQNNFVHMKSAISKSQNRGGNNPPTPNKKSNEKGPWRFYFDVGKKDPNAMDIDVMSMEKRAALKVGNIQKQHPYVSHLYKCQEQQNVAFENFQKIWWTNGLKNIVLNL